MAAGHLSPMALPTTVVGLSGKLAYGFDDPLCTMAPKQRTRPYPTPVELAASFGLSFSNSAGMTFGHAIFVRRECAQDSRLLTHELVHVRQYEEAPSIGAYLSVYVQQLTDVGYEKMPLEDEANRETMNIWGPPKR